MQNRIRVAVADRGFMLTWRALAGASASGRLPALLVLLACLLIVQPPARAQEAPYSPDSDIVADPAVTYGALPNGMRYALMRNDLPPRSVSIRLLLRAGSLHEREDQRGLFHFIEHMAFNGSPAVPEGEMVRRLARLGVAFGADVNAVTGQSHTLYALDLPEASGERLDESLFLLRELASELSFEGEAVARERGVILAEYRRNDTFERRRREQQFAFLAPDAYAIDRMPIGDPDTIAMATGESLRPLYDRYYRPERATLVVVGDFDPGTIETLIEQNFATWRGRGEGGDDVDATYMPEEREAAASVFVHPDGGDAISVYFVSPYHAFPDTVAGHRERFLLALGVAAVNRRLVAAANSSDPPFRAGSVFRSDVLESASFSGAAAATRPGEWKAGLVALEQVWRSALTHGFMQEEIEREIAGLRKVFVDAAESEATRTTHSLAESLRRSIQEEEVFASPSSSLKLFEGWLPGATPEAVAAVFRKWMARGVPLFFLSSSVDLPGVEADIIAAWSQSEQTAVEKPESKAVPAFGYASFGSPGRVASDRRLANLDARAILFDNNVRLTLKRTPHQQGAMLVSLRVGAGAIALEDAPFGLASLMSAYTAAGLEKHSLDELRAILGGHTLRAGLSVSPDSFGGVYLTTPDDLQLQLQLAAAYVMHPGYRPEAEKKWRESVVLSWPRLDANARNIFASQGARLLLSGDKRFGTHPDDGAVFRSFTELEAYLGPILRSAAIEIAIVGDFVEADAISSVAATFGALPARAVSEPKTASAYPAIFAAQQSPIVLTHRGEADAGLLKFYWPVDLDEDREPQKSRVLGVLASVLHLRLLEVVREDLGASYAPSAGFSSSTVYPGLNYLYADIEANPDDMARLRMVVRDLAADLRRGDISTDELERARAPALDQLAGYASSNGYWLSVMAQAQSRPDRSNQLNLGTIEAGLRAISLDDLREAASDWLGDRNIREVIILPAMTGPPAAE